MEYPFFTYGKSIADFEFIHFKDQNMITMVSINDNADSNPNPIDDLLIQGDTALNEGNYEKAIQYYDKVLAIDPNDTEAVNSKGISLDNLGT
jgi:Flp pilus assembly protein TadD